MTFLDGSFNILATQQSQIGNTVLYTGRQYDPESETYYYRNRYYHSFLGTFTRRDPLGYVDGENLYCAYFAISGNDPYGLSVGIAGPPIIWGGPACWVVVGGAVGCCIAYEGSTYVCGKIFGPTVCTPIQVNQPQPGQPPGQPPKKPPHPPDPGPCDFYLAWCLWGSNPKNSPGKGWKKGARCLECFRDCKENNGIWSFGKCPLGDHGPRWRGPDGSVWPDPGTW